MEVKVATPDMVREANPPKGYMPIASSSAFGWETGPMFEKVDENGWSRGFRVTDKHTNVAGMCHGGMIMTFSDIVLSRGMVEAGFKHFVTVRLTTDFIRAVPIGAWVSGQSVAHEIDSGMVALTAEFCVDYRVVATSSGLFKSIRPQRK